MTEEEAFEPARKMIYWTIAVAVITIVVFASFMIMTGYKGKLTKAPSQLRAELISLRFVNAPECFAYQDKITGRVFPGVIDLNKFDETRMGNCYQSGDVKNFNFQLVLGEKTVETDKWFNKVDFTLFKKVLVKEGEEIRAAILKIYVQEKI